MSATTQADLDAEDAAEFLAALRKLAARQAKALAEESRRRAAYKSARKELRFADAALERLAAAAAGDEPPGDWLRRLSTAYRRAEAALETRVAARLELERAVFERRRLQDELRARIKKQNERYPLFDEPNSRTNGTPGTFGPKNVS